MFTVQTTDFPSKY